MPAPGSHEELELARLLTGRLEALLGPVVAELFPRTVDPPGRRRRWTRLTWLFVGKPKGPDRDGRPAG
jgi:hypothetical protein